MFFFVLCLKEFEFNVEGEIKDESVWERERMKFWNQQSVWFSLNVFNNEFERV